MRPLQIPPRMSVFVILAPLFALTAILPGAAAQTIARRPADVTEIERLIVERTNALRRSHGAGPADPDANLTATARDFAAFMAHADRFGHEADGRTPAQRVERHGYAWCLVLENIGSVYDSRGLSTQELAGRIVQGWEQSPGHRRNMLDADATDIGVGIARSEVSGTYYAVQLFGRSRAMGCHRPRKAS